MRRKLNGHHWTKWVDRVFDEVAGDRYWQQPGFATGTNTRVASSCVYFLRAMGVGRIKLGVTTNLAGRIAALQVGSPTRLELVGTLAGSYALENCLKERFRKHHVHGEWYTDRILPDVIEMIREEEGFYAA